MPPQSKLLFYNSGDHYRDIIRFALLVISDPLLQGFLVKGGFIVLEKRASLPLCCNCFCDFCEVISVGLIQDLFQHLLGLKIIP